MEEKYNFSAKFILIYVIVDTKLKKFNCKLIYGLYESSKPEKIFIFHGVWIFSKCLSFITI